MNIKSTRRAFWFILPAEYDVMYTRRCGFGGVVILPLIIKRILGIRRIFLCSFANKHMRLLTRVYGKIPSPFLDLTNHPVNL